MQKTAKKQAVIKKHQAHKTDTGSAEVQIGVLTMKIEELAAHLQTHKKDNHSRRGLITMVAERRKQLAAYKSKDAAKHDALLKKIKLG